MSQGAKIHLNHSFQGRENKTLLIKHKGETLQVTPDIIIGADGPLSRTAKAFDFYHPERKNYFGMQATIEGEFNMNEFQAFLTNDFAPGLFAWIVPESPTIARVGLGTTKNTRHYFNEFLKSKNFTPIDIQAGTIPVYHPKQLLFKDNCYLLGDAATFVKATTLGGLNPGLRQAEILVDSLLNKKDYLKELKPVRKRLALHLKLRKILDKFSNEDWNDLVKLVNQKKIQSILEKHTRENPLPIVLKSLLKEPRFFKYIKYLF